MTYAILERLMKIHKKIASGCNPNTKDLAVVLESSQPTISRSIEFMRNRMQAPICYDKAHNGYYYESKFDMLLFSVSQKDGETLAEAESLGPLRVGKRPKFP